LNDCSSNANDKIKNICDIIKDNFDQNSINSLCSPGNIFDKVYSEFTKNSNNDIFNAKQEESPYKCNNISSKNDKNISSHENNSTSNVDQMKENDIITDTKLICDICEMKPIKGERYECNTCNVPYNICGNCYEFKDDLHFSDHIFKCHISSDVEEMNNNQSIININIDNSNENTDSKQISNLFEQIQETQREPEIQNEQKNKEPENVEHEPKNVNDEQKEQSLY
jgi:hypothetical protein